ncbi:MAG: ethylbenzene dehydrogenase-related protein [Acidimicrobiia bacterium]
MNRTLSRWALVVVVVMVAVLFRVTDTNPAMAQTQRIGAWQVTTEPGLDGSAPEWQSIVPVFLPATAQQVAPPMGGGSVERLSVRAVHWEDRLYVMLEWVDLTEDNLSDRTETFTDAAAIQFPAVAGSAVPYICMGQADQAVNIWHWRSDQQQPLPGLSPDGYVDLDPPDDDLYFPARAAQNPLSRDVGRVAVQNLVAGGFGTLTATDNGSLVGHGVRVDNRWSVVFTRPFVAEGSLQPTFSGDEPIDVSFAVWDGNKQERNGIKSVSSFTQLTVTPSDPPRRAVAASGDWPAYTPSGGLTGAGIIVTIVVLVGAAVAAVWASLRRALKEAESDGS